MEVFMNYWLVKSEPAKYSFDQFMKDKKTYWDGVRNYTARNNLRAMKIDDLVLYYHSNDGLEIVGIAKVIREAYQDPTTSDDAWVVVDLAPVEKLKTPVTLVQIKEDKKLENMVFAKQGRLSVSPVTAKEYERIMELGM